MIVIQARGFIVLRHTDDDRFFLKGEGTTEVARDSVKIEVNKPVLRLPDCSNLKNTTKASTKNRHARWGNRTVLDEFSPNFLDVFALLCLICIIPLVNWLQKN